MTETHKLIAEIDAYLRSSGMAESTFGKKSVNDGKLVGRLRGGGSVTLETAAQLRGFIVAQVAFGLHPANGAGSAPTGVTE